MFKAVDPTPEPLATFRFLDLPLELQRHIISLLYHSYPITVFVSPAIGSCRLSKSFPTEPLLVNRHFLEQFKPVVQNSYARRLKYELDVPDFELNHDFLLRLEHVPSIRKFFILHARRIERIDNAPECRNLSSWFSKFPNLRYINFADLLFTQKFNTFGGSVGWYHMKVNISIFERSLAELLEGRCDSSYSDYVIGKFRRYRLVSVSKSYTSKELADIQDWFKNVTERTTITFTHVMELSGPNSPWAEQYKKFRMPGDLLVSCFLWKTVTILTLFRLFISGSQKTARELSSPTKSSENLTNTS